MTPRCLGPGLYWWHGQKKKKGRGSSCSQTSRTYFNFHLQLNMEPSHLIGAHPLGRWIQMPLICSPEVNAHTQNRGLNSRCQHRLNKPPNADKKTIAADKRPVVINHMIAARGLIYFIAANTILQPTICGLIKETNNMSCRIYPPWLKCHRELNLV